MWGDGEELDFGDEDDVGALLAKARMELAPNTTQQKRQKVQSAVQHSVISVQAQIDTLGPRNHVDISKLIRDGGPTVSSSSFSLKQRSVSPQLMDEDSWPKAPDLIGRGQPLANVTNSVLPVGPLPFDTIKLPQSMRRLQAKSKLPHAQRRDSGDSTVASEMHCYSTSSQTSSGGACTRSEGGLLRDSALEGRLSDVDYSPPPGRRFDAAEKGKQIVSMIENRLKPVSTTEVISAKAPVVAVIPGPAGAVQRALAQGRSTDEAQILKASGSQQASVCLEGTPDEDFSKGSWLAAVSFVKREEARAGTAPVTHLKDLRRSKTCKRTARLVVIVKSMVPTGDGDASATFKDPTGTAEGTLHRKLLADKQLGPISPGTTLVLQEVVVFRPVPRTFYLSILASNVLKVFPTKTPIPATHSFPGSCDPALEEPSWEAFDRPPSSHNSGDTPRALPAAAKPSSCDGLRQELPPGQDQSVEPRTLRPGETTGLQGLRIGEPVECRDGAGTLSRESLELPHSRSFGAFDAAEHCEPFGPASGSDRGQHPSTGDKTGVEQPSVAAQDADRGGIRWAAGGASKALQGSEGEGLNPKRGRDAFRTGNGHLDIVEPGQGTTAVCRGPGPLSADIQQLLAGLDEEDWFLGEEPPPPNKKSRELEENLLF